MTRAANRRAALSSKRGFSVVAPMSVTGAVFHHRQETVLCARLKRWISSTKSSVPRPIIRRERAASKTFLRSATPEKIAEICSKARSVSRASRRATVVLPVPGAPRRSGCQSSRRREGG